MNGQKIERKMARRSEGEPNVSDDRDVDALRKARFRIIDHPWIFLLAFLILSLFLMILFISLMGSAHMGLVVMIFIIMPLVWRLSRNRRSLKEHMAQTRWDVESPTLVTGLQAIWSYWWAYLDDIRLIRVRPIVPLLTLSLTCYLILWLSQAAGPVAYRITQNQRLTTEFILSVLDISDALPPGSSSLFDSINSIFEEMAWRGVALALFLRHWSNRKAILVSSFGFAILHLLNLTGDREPVWVFAQVGWSFILGLWYGYSVIKTNSLVPAMIIHWLSNAFVWSITNTLDAAPAETQALYGLIFTFGLLPSTLMILWTRFFAAQWLPAAGHFSGRTIAKHRA